MTERGRLPGLLLGVLIAALLPLLPPPLAGGALAAFASPLSLGAGLPGRRPAVLILYSSDRTLLGNRMIAEGLRRTLLLEGGLSAQEIFEEDLDLARHPEGGYLERAARYLETKYAGRRIGLVVAIQRPAADFLLRRVRGPLGEAPW